MAHAIFPQGPTLRLLNVKNALSNRISNIQPIRSKGSSQGFNFLHNSACVLSLGPI